MGHKKRNKPSPKNRTAPLPPQPQPPATIYGPQPYPSQGYTQQPYPQGPVPQPYPQGPAPQPYPQGPVPQPYPQGYAPQYFAQGPQPYPPNGYLPQPYPPTVYQPPPQIQIHQPSAPPLQVNGRTLAAPEVDPNFEGPRKDRSCRDIIFLILFIAFCVGGIIYLAVAYSKGDVRRFTNGVDKYGNICGVKNEQYFDITESGQDFTQKKFFNLLDQQCMAVCPADTVIVGFYCLPSQAAPATTSTTASATASTASTTTTNDEPEEKSMFKEMGQDLQRSWHWILVICAIGLGLSIVMIILLRFLAAIVVWITVVVIVLATIAGTIFLWVKWYLVQQDPNNEGHDTKFLVAAIFATIGTVLILVLLIAMRKRIKLVIVLFKEAGKAVAAMPLMIFMPLWTVLIFALVGFVGVGGQLLIEAAGTPVKTTDGGVDFAPIPIIEYMRLYHIFGLFWVTQFVVACQDITVAGAVSAWYFTRDKKLLSWPILTGMKFLILYHLGSAAFGALIIAIVQMIRYLLKQLQKRMGSNSGVGCFLKCVQCYLGCFEKWLKYLTRNAYIEIAIYGHGFCKSAQKAFAIITQNAFRVTAINFVGDFVLLLAKIAIVVPTGFIGYEIIKAQDGITYEFLPVFLGCLGTFLIAHCFISIYEMTIDTLFVCFCEDCNMNDGISKPYFMNRGLMQFVENSKKALEQHDANVMAKKNGDPWVGQGGGGGAVQQVGPYQIGASAFPSQMPTPQHHPGAGMSPLHPAYKANSMPPTPAKLAP